MYFYASGWTGTGAQGDPFRPAVVPLLSGSWQAIDLRRDVTVRTGLAIVGTDARCVETGELFTRWASLTSALAARDAGLPGARYLGDESTTLSVVARSVWGRIAGFDTRLDSTTVGAALAEVLVTRALAGGSTVPPLQPERDGVRRIRLGGQVWEV